MLWIPANITFAVHFFGMQNFTAMWVAIGSAFRETIAVFFSKTLLNIFLVFLVIAVWSIAFILSNNIFDYLPAIATTFVCTAVYFKNNFYLYRFWMIGHNIAWFIFYVTIGSYAGTVQITLFLFSNIIGMSRYFLNNRNASQSDKTIG